MEEKMMRLLYLFLLSLLLICQFLLAQAPDTLWTKTLGGTDLDFGSFVQQTIDGGYIIVGSSLIKTDSIGNELWSKNIEGVCVQQTTDEGYIVTGGTANGDILLIKTDSYGDTLWKKTFGGEHGDAGSSVQQTSDGGYIITGSANGEAYSIHETFLMKTDSLGDTLWTKFFFEESWGDAVIQTSDGGYILTGYTSLHDIDSSGVLLLKTDASGNTLWTKTFGGISEDIGYSVQQTTDGGYIICGNTNSFGAGYQDIWLIKLAPDPIVGVSEITTPSNFRLSQNFPNPFNPTTTIKYSVPKLSFVTIKVFDVLGNGITVLVNEEKHVGNYEVEFDATKLSSGVYFYRLQAGDFVDTKKMVLLK
jgi:hypothetical protein